MQGIPEVFGCFRSDLFAVCGEQLVTVLSLYELPKHLVLVLSVAIIRNAGGVAWMEDEDTGQDQCPPPTASPWVDSRMRRIFECAVAGLALTGLLPVLALCSIVVRCSSRGPVFFRQRRMGRDGCEFELYKFRSMRCQSKADEPGHTVHNDRRVTKAGALLRRYKLDELPQFWNVLKGDMSLVGPRPKLPHHESLCMPYRPGLTGQATLAFRHEERMLLEVPSQEIDDFYEEVVKPIKAELDIRYMERATFRSDVGVLGLTMLRCLNSTADGRKELRALLSKHAPQHIHLLAPPRTLAPVIRLKPPDCIAELTDEFAGDLDDAV